MNAYFRGKKELFVGLKMETLEKEWKHHEVINISFNVGTFTNEDGLQKSLNSFFQEVEQRWGYVFNPTLDLGGNLRALILCLHQQVGEKVVVLVDEYVFLYV